MKKRVLPKFGMGKYFLIFQIKRKVVGKETILATNFGCKVRNNIVFSPPLQWGLDKWGTERSFAKNVDSQARKKLFFSLFEFYQD